MPDLDLNKLMEMAQNAQSELQRAANAEMQKVTSGLPLPPGMKLPF